MNSNSSTTVGSSVESATTAGSLVPSVRAGKEAARSQSRVSVIARIVAAGSRVAGPPSPAGRTATEAWLGHRSGVQEPIQLVGVETPFERELADRPSRLE